MVDPTASHSSRGASTFESMAAENLPPSQRLNLRWNNYHACFTSAFDQLLQSESFVDVTLACDGRSLKAHKVVLSACSPYFQDLFFANPCKHPVVIITDVKWPELKAAVDFMYKGEINVSQDQIGPLLSVAESLKIRGLTDVNPDVVSPTRAKRKATTPPECSKAPKRQHPTPEMQSHNKDKVARGKGLPPDCQSSTKSNNKVTWSQSQLQLAMASVITQKMRFTEASAMFNIPKGTLYDNVLGKTKRMEILEEAGLTAAEELEVIRFCCVAPPNRKTDKPLGAVLSHVERLRRERDPSFAFTGMAGFRWWWAFCKKHSIVSSYFNED